ncbi:30S ribosomal protein S1 [Desulfovibrio sp. OttesenSCG-928-G11]|nr:30S ribosomal protein S1 [Desulfovibrio sp. OttesenSCG-928-G11]
MTSESHSPAEAVAAKEAFAASEKQDGPLPVAAPGTAAPVEPVEPVEAAVAPEAAAPVAAADEAEAAAPEAVPVAAAVPVPQAPPLPPMAEEELSFEEMLARHEQEEAPRARLEPGQRVSVRIVAITGDTVFVSTGSKVDGIVDREELETDGQLPYQVGDSLDLYVVTVSAQEVKLSRILRGAGSLLALEEAREAGLPVEGRVTGQVKGGYAVDIMKRRAFCPMGQIDLRPPEDAEAPVGKMYAFLITRLEKGGRNIVVSRRMLLEREQAENLEQLLAQMHEGDVREGEVTRLAPFGAFVELAPGVEGMVHLSELSWSRVGQADEAVSAGDRVRVKIQGIARGEKGTRISLSIKAVTEDPWKEAPARLEVGAVVPGKVTRLAPFGAFVEILPGVEGLAHLSELSYEKRIMKAEEVLAPGDHVNVKIKEVDADKRRISLSLRDVAGDPWDSVHEVLPLDADITGTVEKRAPFGLFITLSPGITGLLANQVIQASPARKTLERLNPGDPVSVRVREIDAAGRRVSLLPAGEEAAGAVEKDWKRHAPRPAPAPSMGALGLALKAAMDKKGK